MNGNKTRAFGATAALLMSLAAAADDTGFYVGAGVGEATQNDFAFHGSDTSFRLLGGYSFSRYLAAEAGYVDGGKQKGNVGGLRATAASKGTFAAVIGKLPLGRYVSPYAKFGYVAYDSRNTLSNATQTVVESTSDEDILYGGGLEVRLGDRFRLRADYEKIRVPDVAYDIYTLVATWQF
jgi:OOP family OmpA-OmpF porin